MIHDRALTVEATRINYVWLLPLLEWPFGQVVGDLPQALNDRGLPEPVEARDVSFREIVATGLGSGSTCWIALAVGWIERGVSLGRGARRADRPAGREEGGRSADEAPGVHPGPSMGQGHWQW